jgi:hypothetical protein
MSCATSDSVNIDHRSRQEIYCGAVAGRARRVENILIQLMADIPQLAPFSWMIKLPSPILRHIGTRDLQPPLSTNDMDLGA